MAAPNIVGVTTITAKTDGLAVTTSNTAIVTNSAASGQVYKINTLIAGNTSGSAQTISVDVFKNQTTAYRIATTVNVPANSTIVVLAKDSAIYLEENDSLRVQSGANDLEAICSYEIIE